MKCQILFSEKKNKKTIINLSSAEFAHSAVSVKEELKEVSSKRSFTLKKRKEFAYLVATLFLSLSMSDM